MTIRISNYETSCTNELTIVLIKVKSCNALLHMLLVCIRKCCYLKSVLRYELLILGTYHPAAYIYVSKDVRIRGCFLKPNRVREQKRL